MKDSIYCIFFALFLACSGQKNEADGALPSLKITMDTVVIDSGEEILFLNGRLRLSALSENKKYLYNINRWKYSIEQINLNTLAFEKKYTFEKEGPNGTDGYIMGLSLVNDEQLLLSTYQKANLFTWQGKKLNSLNIFEIGKAHGQLDEGDRTQSITSISPNNNITAFFISNQENKTTLLGILDPKNDLFKKIPIPGIEKAKNFEIMLNDNNRKMVLVTSRFLTKEGGKIIAGTEISSEIYVLDKNSDTLFNKTFSSRLTKNEKTGTYPKEVGDRRQFEDYSRKIYEDITFRNPVWDEKKKVYYRFSFQMKYDDNAKLKEGQEFPQPFGATVYLSILDKKLNLIAEGKVPELNNYPPFHFAKDGQLWLFENIEDEMGFVRLDISW